MNRPRPIIKGDAMTRTYTRYESDGVTPKNFTGETVLFKLVQGTLTIIYTEAGGDLVVTPTAGRVVVTLSGAKTSLLNSSRKSHSYLEFSGGADGTYTRGATREQVDEP